MDHSSYVRAVILMGRRPPNFDPDLFESHAKLRTAINKSSRILKHVNVLGNWALFHGVGNHDVQEARANDIHDSKLSFITHPLKEGEVYANYTVSAAYAGSHRADACNILAGAILRHMARLAEGDKHRAYALAASTFGGEIYIAYFLTVWGHSISTVPVYYVSTHRAKRGAPWEWSPYALSTNINARLLYAPDKALMHALRERRVLPSWRKMRFEVENLGTDRRGPLLLINKSTGEPYLHIAAPTGLDKSSNVGSDALGFMVPNKNKIWTKADLYAARNRANRILRLDEFDHAPVSKESGDVQS